MSTGGTHFTTESILSNAFVTSTWEMAGGREGGREGEKEREHVMRAFGRGWSGFTYFKSTRIRFKLDSSATDDNIQGKSR